MSDSEPVTNKQGEVTDLNEPDAVNLFRIELLASSLRLYEETGFTLTRGFGITKMLNAAQYYTQKKYKRTEAGYLQAADDLQVLANELKTALPVRQR